MYLISPHFICYLFLIFYSALSHSSFQVYIVCKLFKKTQNAAIKITNIDGYGGPQL